MTVHYTACYNGRYDGHGVAARKRPLKHTIEIGKLWVCYNERYDGHGVAARKRPLNHVFWDMFSDVTTWYNKPERVINR